jgi:hypothetical protein
MFGLYILKFSQNYLIIYIIMLNIVQCLMYTLVKLSL